MLGVPVRCFGKASFGFQKGHTKHAFRKTLRAAGDLAARRVYHWLQRWKHRADAATSCHQSTDPDTGQPQHGAVNSAEYGAVDRSEHRSVDCAKHRAFDKPAHEPVAVSYHAYRQ